ncbi:MULTISPECIES: YncE family protein [Elizabethkingia]|uniref:YncE family protein n=1 Tax=Elizabethkingia TaxID=308865 RepID=UPI0007417E30|nr:MULTISPECIES: hypothetical protein [Elizabethkingia]KUG13904.1 hypothetical protein AMC91_01230 [Elizabethkingia miricola]MCL1658467.1 hypothetical protein [Elizabethkingia miricola]MCP1253859.1 hypothetical protein [Elizabethkingia sp. S0634]
MKKNILLQFTLGAVLLINTACSSDRTINNEEPQKPLRGPYDNGIIIENEGTWTDMNASVDFISNDFTKFTSNIYNLTNNEELGKVLISITFKDDLAYMVLNSSNVVKIVNRYTFKKVGEITTGIKSPRYVAVTDKYIYITNNTSFDPNNYVSIYNVSNFSLLKTVNIDNGAEKIAIANGNIFVDNSGSSGIQSKISYINGMTNTLQSVINLPNGRIQNLISENNDVYAIASKYKEADSYIYKVSGQGTLTKTIVLRGIASASDLRIYKGKFYFTSGAKIYSMDINADNPPAAPLFTTSLNNRDGFFTGFNIIDDKIFTAESDQYEDTSTVHVYTLTGAPVKTFITGRGTSGLHKN